MIFLLKKIINLIMKYYCVLIGRKTGIFLTWDETKKYVNGYPGAKYKSFTDLAAAQKYLGLSEDISEDVIEDVNDKPKIYTDGSCVSKVGGYGVVIIDYSTTTPVRKYSGKVPVPETTNQYSELYAIKMALQLADIPAFDLYTDSKYSIGCLTEWHFNWLQNGWKNSKGESVVNKELIQEILELLKQKEVKFYHVRAHKGDTYNEMADQLANEGRMK